MPSNRWRVNRSGPEWLMDQEGRLIGYRDLRGREYFAPFGLQPGGMADSDEPVGLDKAGAAGAQALVAGDGMRVLAGSLMGGDWSQMPEPWVVTHQGAGRMLAPAEYPEAYMMGLSMGTGVVDGGDWRTTSDSQLVMFHDATIDALTTGTGNVSAQTLAAMKALTIDGSSWFGGGWPDRTGAMDADTFFGMLQGQVLLTPEPKDSTAATNLSAYLVRRGMKRACLVNAFTDALLTPFINAGFPYLCRLLAAGSEHSSFTTSTAAAYIASGVRYVGVDSSDANAPQVIARALQAGMKPAVFFANRQWSYDYWTGLGAVGVWSEQPLYASRQYARYRRSRTNFAAGYSHGDVQKGDLLDPASRGARSSSGAVFSPTTTSNWFSLVPDINPVPDKMAPRTYTTTISITTRAPDARWGPCIPFTPDDKPYDESGATSNGIELTVRPSQSSGGGSVGTMRLALRAAGVLGTTVFGNLSAELTNGSSVTLAATITPTSSSSCDVTVVASGGATGTVTMTGCPFNPEYVHMGTIFNSNPGVFGFSDFVRS